MADNLPSLYPTSPQGSFLSKVTKHAGSNALQSSKDFRVAKTAHGTTIRLADGLQNFPTHFLNDRGEYVPDAQYSVGDIVWVYHDTNYTSEVTELVVEATPGVWICTAEVPDLYNSNVFKEEGYTEGNFIRQDGIEYQPTYPEPATNYEDVSSSSDPIERAGVRYWKLFSMLPRLTNVCIDGVNTPYYVDSVASGSFGAEGDV